MGGGGGGGGGGAIYLWAIANKFLQAVKKNKTNSFTYGKLRI
eukprot:SAG31_NODE_14359_length_811_cov_1.411517_1_plen_41_part_10